MSNKDDELEKILNEFRSDIQPESDASEIKEDEAPQVQEPTEAEAPQTQELPEEKAEAPEAEEAFEEQAPETADESVSFNDESDLAESFDLDEWQENYGEYDDAGDNSNKKKIIIAIVAIVAIVAIACAAFFGFFYEKEEPTTTTTKPPTTTTTQAPVIIKNPLTGEKDYNESAVDLRPIALVVDNASGARPQYNIEAADIIVEGEVEGGETRMLWLFADMTSLPEQLGPTRSARPSFVQFSELFDSIFVHYGGSHSKGDYVGGYEVISADGVDDIDGMSVSACFTRTSDKYSPHNAALLGDKLLDVINSKGYRTTVDKNSFSAFKFSDEVSPVSQTQCISATVKFSSITNSHTFTYNDAEKVYTNQGDFKTPVSFTNVIVLFAESTYIVKHDYKTAGNSETYLNYSLTSGSGKLISCGTAVDFNWSVNNGKLSFTDMNGRKLSLNPGKSYIALASSNYSGSVTVEAPQVDTAE